MTVELSQRHKTTVYLSITFQNGDTNNQAVKLWWRLKPCTDVASNLLAIYLRLGCRIACDCVQQKFQHADFQTVFTVILRFS